jgi:CheY-like chemotaxis protein
MRRRRSQLGQQNPSRHRAVTRKPTERESLRESAGHWIVSVARVARLESASDLDVPADTPPEEAWSTVLETTGVEPERLTQYVADHFELEVADLSRLPPKASRLLPSMVARALSVVPLRRTDSLLVVATADPEDLQTLGSLQQASGRKPVYEVASPKAIAAALARAYPTVPSPPKIPHPEPSARRVLVVDDDADARLIIRSLLEKEGFVVDEASDGAMALDMVTSGRHYELMTLDLYMEGVHGLGVLQHVRAHVPTAALPVLVTTGSDDPTVHMRLIDAGADECVVKPVDPPRFLLRVRSVLRRRAARPGGGA